MRARRQLAGLSYNYNVGREQAQTKSGALRYRLVFPKAKGRWVVKKCYDETSAEILKDLMNNIHEAKMEMLQRRVPTCVREYTVPDDIPKNIASIEVPDKQQAIAQHMSRLQQ